MTLCQSYSPRQIIVLLLMMNSGFKRAASQFEVYSLLLTILLASIYRTH